MPKSTDESQRFVLSKEDIVEVPREAPTPKRSDLSEERKAKIKQLEQAKRGS